MRALRRLGLTLGAFVLAVVSLHAQTWATTSLTFHTDASDTDRLWKEYAMSNHPATTEKIAAWDDEGDATGFAFTSSVDSPTNAPIYRASGIGGLGSTEFSGATSVNEYLVARNDSGSGNRTLADFITDSAYTILVAVSAQDVLYNNANVYDNPGPIVDTNAAFGMQFTVSAGQFKVWAYNFDGSVDKVSQDFTGSTDYVIRMRHDSGTLYLQTSTGGVAGSETSVASGSTTTLGGSLLLGNYWIGNTACTCRIGEVLIYNAAISGSDLSDTTAYMINKWTTGGGASGSSGTVPTLGPFLGGPFVARNAPRGEHEHVAIRHHRPSE